MKILIGADKGGYAIKEAIALHLQELGMEYEDIGIYSMDKPIPFTELASKVGERIQSGESERAILVCGTGMGMAITANKFKGVRAAVVESQYAAMYSRKINDANVLCLGGFIVGATMACEIVDTFLETEFVEDFPQWRVDFLNSQKAALAEIEDRNFKD